MASSRGKDVELTDVEKEILEEISQENYKELYIALRKTTTNQCLLVALHHFKMHDFEFRVTDNLIEKQEGEIFIEDLEAINRDMDEDVDLCVTPTVGSVRFGICTLLHEQLISRQLITWCFGLNTCQLDQSNVSNNNFEILFNNFNEFFRNNRPHNVLEKKYLIFPVSFVGNTYVTMFINPMGAVHKSTNNSKETPVMIHYGTDHMDVYKRTIVPRILAIIRFFVDLYMPTLGYLKLMEDRFKVFEHVLPEMKLFEKATQMYYLIYQLTQTKLSDNLKTLEGQIADIAKDSEENTAVLLEARSIVALRIGVAITNGPKKSAVHLYHQRVRIADYQKERRERLAAEGVVLVKKEESEDSDSDDSMDEDVKGVKKEELKSEDVEMEDI